MALHYQFPGAQRSGLRPWRMCGTQGFSAFSLMRLVFVLGFARSSFGDVFTNSAAFALTPGQSAFGLQLPQFSSTAYSLRKISIVITAEFGANISFRADPLQSVTYSWALGLAQPASPSIEVLPGSQGLLVPPSVSLPLFGTQSVAPGLPTTLQAVSANTQTVETTAPEILALYRGTGAVQYDVNFLARYPQVVATTPTGPNAVFTDDRITGQLSIIYEAFPTSETLHATIERLGDGIRIGAYGGIGQQVLLQDSDSAVNGFWNPVGIITLDSNGHGFMDLTIGIRDITRFYRLLAPY